jgi:hypothetical protein
MMGRRTKFIGRLKELERLSAALRRAENGVAMWW